MRRTTWARRHRSGLSAPLFVILLLAQPARVWSEGSLWQMREDVRAAPASGSSDGNRDDDRDDDDRRKRRRHDPFCEDEDPWSELTGPLFLAACYGAAWVAASPFWAPAKLVGDNYDTRGTFALHPYRDDLDGFMVLEDVAHQESYIWSMRGRAEYADDFDDQLRFGGNLLLESAIRFGIDTSFDYRRESIASGIHDSLWTGDANIVFRFAQSQKLMMRTGLGVNWLSDQYGSDFGFNFTYGGDWFPREPWVMSAEIDWGRLGRAELFHGRGTIGLNFRHWEVFTGYDFYHVGRAELSGLVSGVRFWY
jgi:hypothetical protein